MRFVWILFGFTALGVGVLGIFLPLVPTVPLVLLAAFCFAKSSERLHKWLTGHKTFGPMISDWNENGAIRPNAKKMATMSIAIVFGISLILGLPTKVLVIQAVTLTCVLVFIWSRPSS
jgi:uncharacterized membrane protein YbaN (DUF454 family)